ARDWHGAARAGSVDKRKDARSCAIWCGQRQPPGGIMKNRIVSTLIAAAALLAPLPLQAQVPPGVRLDATGHPGPNIAPEEYSRPRRTISPIIHPDRSVTLKVNAPLAREVRVTGHIIGMNAHWLSAPRKSIAMTKGADGIWSVTLGPLKPDIYDYGYLVDGYPAGDIGNRVNYVEVPGDGPAYYDAQ